MAVESLIIVHWSNQSAEGYGFNLYSTGDSHFFFVPDSW